MDNNRIRFDWTLASIEDIVMDAEDRNKFSAQDAKKITALCDKLRVLVAAAEEKYEKQESQENT